MANRDLNVILGLRVRDFERGLRNAERSLQRTARRMNSIGTDLAQTVSIPLAALGGGAIRAAADFEQLQNALTAITGDANEAAEEFDRLRKVAEAPGLGLEQAVRASTGLQAVGLSANQARETIQEYGNAVARSGGGAAEFDGAILALTQIASKGKISAEEINQLGERIKEIRPVLTNAFGTANSEELQNLGITAEEFIAKTTAEFAKLERVQGGLANSLENATIATKAFLAELGNEINEVLEIEGLIGQFTSRLNNLIQTFKLLSPETKRAIINFGLYAAAAGPALIATGKFLNIISIVPGQIKVFSENIRGAVNSVDNLRKSFLALSLAQKATIIGLVTVAVVALVAAFSKLRDRFEDTTETARSLVGVQNEAAAAAAEEEAKVKPLIEVLKDENATKEEKRRALDQLQSQYPSYFGHLDAENLKIKDISDAYLNFSSSIIAVSKARAAEAKLSELARKEIELLAEQQEIANDRQKEGLAGFLARQTAGAGRDALVLREQEVNEQLDSIEEQRAKLVDLIKESNRDLAGSTPDAPIAPSRRTTTTTEISTSERSARPDFSLAALNASAIDFSGIEIATQRIESLTGATAPLIERVDLVRQGFIGLEEVFRESEENERLANLQRRIENFSESAAGIAQTLAPAFQDFFTTIEQGGTNAFQAFTDVVKQAIKQLVSALATSFLLASVFSIFTGGIGFGALFKNVFSSLGGFGIIPGLADGGIIPPGFPNDTFPARLSSGEAVIPLDRLGEFGGGGTLQTRVSGSDLLIILDRARKENNRVV